MKDARPTLIPQLRWEGIRNQVVHTVRQLFDEELEDALQSFQRSPQENHASSSEVVETLTDGGISLDTGSRRVAVRGQNPRLTPKEFGLLTILLRRKNSILTRRFLLEHVWGYNYFGTDRTVDVHIRTLREKLGSVGSRIETVERIGYLFRSE